MTIVRAGQGLSFWLAQRLFWARQIRNALTFIMLIIYCFRRIPSWKCDHARPSGFYPMMKNPRRHLPGRTWQVVANRWAVCNDSCLLLLRRLGFLISVSHHWKREWTELMTHSVSGVPHRISGRLDFDSGHGLLLCCLCVGSLQNAQQSLVNRNCIGLFCTSPPQALVIGLSLQVLIVLFVKEGIVSSFPCCSRSVRDTLKTINQTLKSPLLHSRAIALSS